MPVGSDFGQREPLTTRLHNLVRSYPKGLGIFKEFIQNADDAEASEIRFIIDERHYTTTGLPESMRWLHETPALMVFNNRAFTDTDLKGIQNIGESGKSRVVEKTGRFGLGFNACYNITDVPCFYTRGHLHYFDPHHKTIPGASDQSPGKMFSEESLREDRWPVFEPFDRLHSPENEFEGTIFRLPFRSVEHAKQSKIRKEPYSISDCLEMVDDLRAMGSTMLLFLKHLGTLRVERWREDGSLEILVSIELQNVDTVKQHRSAFGSLLGKASAETILSELEENGSIYASCQQEW